VSARKLWTAVGWTYCVLIAAFLLLPVAIMVPASFGASEALQFPPRDLSLRWYSRVLTDPQWASSAALSGRLALLAAAVATLAGLLLGIAHIRLGGVKASLRAFFMLPLVVPHIVLATGLFSILLQVRLLGSASVLGFAHACLALPLTMVLFVTAVESIDPLLWTAASTLGARWPAVLRHVILPNLALTIGAAFLLAFIVSWDEVTFAIFVGPSRTPTLPSRMFLYLSELITPALTAVATLLVGVTLVMGSLLSVLRWLRLRSARTAMREA
jgi:putative spermidine/putrescine transport system permease protein